MRCDLGYERIHPEVGEGLIQPGDVKDGEHDRLLTRLQCNISFQNKSR